MTPSSTGRQFLRTFVLVGVSIAVVFAVDTFLARMEEGESRAEAARLYQDAQNLLAQSHPEQAAERLKDALAINRTNREYQLALGQAELAGKQFEAAEATINNLLLADSTDGPANLTMGRILVKEGKLREATSYYHRAIYGEWKNDPAGNQLKARFELVDLLAQQNAKEELLAELLAVQEEAPDDVPTRMRIGRLFLDAGSPARAADVFRDVLKQDPRNADALTGRGQAEFALGDYRAAIVQFSNALHNNPSDKAAQKGLVLSNAVLELDPTRRGLGSAERFRESRRLLQMTLDESACFGNNPPAASAELLDQAHKAVEARVRPDQQDDAAESDLDLAEKLWQTRRTACPAPPADDPLALIMGKLAR